MLNNQTPTYTANPSTQSNTSVYGGYVPDKTLLNTNYYQPYEQNWQVTGETPPGSTPIKDANERIIGYTDASGVDRVPGDGLPHNAYSMATFQG